MLENRLRDRSFVRAIMLGNAIGGAFGACVEGASRVKISEAIEAGPCNFLADLLGPVRITAGSQMMLFVAEGLIRAIVRGRTKGLCIPFSVVHHGLLRWHVHQGHVTRCNIQPQAGLTADQRLAHRRSPGKSVVESLNAVTSFGARATNNSKGCAPLTFVGPAGVFSRAPFEPAELAQEIAATTHGHSEAQHSAGLLALILSKVRHKQTLERARISAVEELTAGAMMHLPNMDALSFYSCFSASVTKPTGDGLSALETLSISVNIAERAPSFHKGMIDVVSHGGATSSIGAVAGMLLATQYPDEVFLLSQKIWLECSDLMERLAIDLAEAKGWDEDKCYEHFDLYPGW